MIARDVLKDIDDLLAWENSATLSIRNVALKVTTVYEGAVGKHPTAAKLLFKPQLTEDSRWNDDCYLSIELDLEHAKNLHLKDQSRSGGTLCWGDDTMQVEIEIAVDSD